HHEKPNYMMWGVHAIALRPFFLTFYVFFFLNRLDISRSEGLKHLSVLVVKSIAQDYNLKLYYVNVA
ncbi:MAG: hypothetical protein ACPHVQ_04120, partial [Candidatus Puniceispirillaceae bacterium]